MPKHHFPVTSLLQLQAAAQRDENLEKPKLAVYADDTDPLIPAFLAAEKI